jgi:hypothetical protein
MTGNKENFLNLKKQKGKVTFGDNALGNILGKGTMNLGKEYSTSKPLDLVHTDLCGPTQTKSLQGESYFILFIDDFNRMAWVCFIKEKLEALNKFKSFKTLVEN